MAKAELHSSSQTEEQKVKGKSVGSDMVRIVSSMQHGVTFLRIDSAPGGRVEFPGLNDHLKGRESGGILVSPGSSICVVIPRAQWNEINEKYPDAYCLQPGPGGMLAPVHEIASDADYEAQQSELKEFRTGAEPSTPEQVSALKRKGSEV